MKIAILKWITNIQTIKEDESRLSLATFADTPTYSLNGLKTKCKVLKVYDGDTLWIAIIIEKKLRKFKVRMFGYDSAEMHSEQNDKAIEAKQHLESLIQGEKLLNAEFFDYDKYGRPLVKLFVKGCCINDQMVKDGHGKPYYGQTKEKW